MKAITLQNFRAMQLAVKGACGTKAESLILNGIDCIPLSSDCEIIEIKLDIDAVAIKLHYSESESYLPIHCLADDVVEEITDTLRAKAVEIAHRDVMVNGKGELADDKANRRL
jgi:hypothetical protein